MTIPSIERSCVDPEPPSPDKAWISLYQQDGRYLGVWYAFRLKDGSWVVAA